MKELYIGAFLTVALGVLMIVFRDSWSIVFCRFGKRSFRQSKIAKWYPYEKIYDESKAPESFKFMGIISIITGFSFAILGYILRNN